jgi:hypothetical protein
MPVFDPASRPSPADAVLLHGILHPARSGARFQRASLAYPPRQRRAQLVRGLVVLALLGGVCGSALMTTRQHGPSPVAAAGEFPATTGSIGGALR